MEAAIATSTAPDIFLGPPTKAPLQPRDAAQNEHIEASNQHSRGEIKKISCSTRAPLPLKKEAAAESNQELLGGAAPSGPDQRRRAARTGAKSRSPIDVCAPSSLPLAGNRIGGDVGE